MEQPKRARRALSLLLASALLLSAAVGCSKQPPPESTPKVQYATEGVTTVEDPEALQKAVDEMYEQASQPGVGLEYKNGVISSDGTKFSCYIANAASNTYDMFISVYADAELTDERFVSGLLRPGSAFETLSLSSPLEKGDHTMYCAFTQVEEDLETIHAQVVVTMDFTVSG